MENSRIEWTDNTFNPWRGCTKVSPACTYCYADAQAKRNPGTLGVWGPNGTRVVASESMWEKPRTWNMHARKQGVRVKVFCASMADVFEAWEGPMVNAHGERHDLTMQDARRRLFALIDATPHLDWLLLTKRPENVQKMWVSRIETGDDLDEIEYRRNVWIGCTVENQEQADQRIPELLKCRSLSPVLFLSCEPLLGPVDLRHVQYDRIVEIDCLTGKHGVNRPLRGDGPHIDWVIGGGESGPHARPSHPDWFRSLRDQCSAAGVAFHFKQWGEWVADRDSPSPEMEIVKTAFGEFERPAGQSVCVVRPEGGDRVFRADGKFSGESPRQEDAWMVKAGKKRAGRKLDGVEHDEFPRVAL